MPSCCVAVVLVFTLACTSVASSGCIAFRASTTSAIRDAKRAHAPRPARDVRRRGIVATSVGVAELALGAALAFAAYSIMVDPSSNGDGTSENPAGAAGQGVK